MSWIDKHLRQRATYWSRTGATNSGDPVFAVAKSIKVRWEARDVAFTNAAGEEARSNAVVFVKEDMTAGDFLFLGASVVADPTTVVGSSEIQGFMKLPQLIGSAFERRAFLSAR